jgi:hypothetical protein
MLSPQILEGLAPQRKHFASSTGTERGREQDPPAVALDVRPKARERSAETNMVVDQQAGTSFSNLSCESRREGKAMEATCTRMTHAIGLLDARGHRESETLPDLVRHGLGDQVDAGDLKSAYRDQGRLLDAEVVSDLVDCGIGEERANETDRGFTLSRFRR